MSNSELEKRIQLATDVNDGIFLRYLYEQKKNYACDFNDLINFTAYILKHYPDILQKWQDRMQYVMVDEFQDVSAKQYSIAQMLSGKHHNLFIVGDPDQTIYTWRNAHVKLFLDFDKQYPDAQTIVLQTNYRSSPEILKAADTLIQKNVLRYPKVLKATKPNGPKPLFFHAQSEKEEADWISQEIKKLINAGNRYDQIAVLYRSHFLSRSIEESFVKNSVPYKIYSGIEFYARAEIKRAIEEEGQDPDATLEEFLNKAALLSNLDRKEKHEAVKVMTIHSAKGMEFPYVFICGLNEGVFPSRKISTPEEMDEERRIAYVAMTRAIKALYLSDSEGFSNDNVFKLPSRFIFDTGRENLTYVRELPASFEGRVNRIASPNTIQLFQNGDRVVHPVFGCGTIMDVDTKTQSYKIQFDQLKTERNIQFKVPLKHFH